MIVGIIGLTVLLGPLVYVVVRIEIDACKRNPVEWNWFERRKQ